MPAGAYNQAPGATIGTAGIFWVPFHLPADGGPVVALSLGRKLLHRKRPGQTPMVLCGLLRTDSINPVRLRALRQHNNRFFHNKFTVLFKECQRSTSPRMPAINVQAEIPKVVKTKNCRVEIRLFTADKSIASTRSKSEAIFSLCCRDSCSIVETTCSAAAFHSPNCRVWSVCKPMTACLVSDKSPTYKSKSEKSDLFCQADPTYKSPQLKTYK